jgi:ClpP class serine protease|uniref:Serine protease, ClpP class n=1 Tax=Desulfobacca acetoxidans TaxID=60893 RepID=A0A7V6A5Q4_9BACT
MTPNDLFWLFLIIIAMQPLFRQKALEFARRRCLVRLEKQRSSRVIIMVHRQETMALLGFPIFRFIDINDSEEVIRAIHLTDPDIPIDLILHTPGGLVLASLQIARAMSKRPGKVTVFVPHYAMSGGTLIALAADEIVMCEHAVLGPVDPQIGQLPAASLLRAAAKKPVEHLEDKTLVLADQAEMAIVEVRNSIRELLLDKFPSDKAEELAGILTEGRWTHDFPITFEVAKALGLPVSSEMPKEIIELMSYFPQPTRAAQAVEYLPIPRRSKPS